MGTELEKVLLLENMRGKISLSYQFNPIFKTSTWLPDDQISAWFKIFRFFEPLSAILTMQSELSDNLVKHSFITNFKQKRINSNSEIFKSWWMNILSYEKYLTVRKTYEKFYSSNGQIWYRTKIVRIFEQKWIPYENVRRWSQAKKQPALISKKAPNTPLIMTLST